MTGGEVRAVVFDVGNVIVEWNRDLLYRQVIPDPSRRAWFFEHVATMAWNLELDRGLPFDDGVLALSQQHPEWASEIAAYRDRWIEMLGPADSSAQELIEDLREQGTTVLGLTNFSAETYPLAVERVPALSLLDGVVVSGREGVVKPERGIYDLLLHRFDVAASQVVFTDDSAANIEGARAAGWQAELWEGAAGFRGDLERLGVLPR